ncbi:MAG TPA: VanZ family protein [Smithellaceae bacterium]|nr:VanZ family protein [Smithellaceae bacterium]HQM44878.1 VanZ family protein [Smithellaceae bacterium]
MVLHFLIIWCLSVGTVIYVSLLPQVELPVDFWNADKAYHLTAYAWLSALAMLSFSVRRTALFFSFSLIILGVLLEIGQLFIPGRSFSFLDIAANSLGVLAGIFVFHQICWWREKNISRN